MSLEKALKTLMTLGLSLTDAKVYVYLAKQGPHEEEELVHALNANDQQLWRSLRTLQNKGFVTSKTKNQTFFIALPLEEVINNIVKAGTEEAQLMKRARENFLSDKYK